MILHYKDLLRHNERQHHETGYQRAITKIRLGLENDPRDTPSKMGTIEKPLLREESIDSTLKKSADKNLFENRRQDDPQGPSSNKKDGLSALRGNDDLGAYFGGNDMFDVSALFRAADYLAGPINMSWRQGQPVNQGSFLEHTMLMDELAPRYESLIEERTHGKSRFTDYKNQRGQNTTGVTMMNSTHNVTGRLGSDRKVRFDNMVLLSSKKSSEEESASERDWMKADLRLGNQTDNAIASWDDSEVAALVQAVNNLAPKSDNPVEQHRGVSFGGDQPAEYNYLQPSFMQGGSEDMILPQQQDPNPFRLSTVPENTLEDFGTQGLQYANYFENYEEPLAEDVEEPSKHSKNQEGLMTQVLEVLEQGGQATSFRQLAKRRLTMTETGGKLDLVASIQALLQLANDGMIAMVQSSNIGHSDIQLQVLDYKLY